MTVTHTVSHWSHWGASGASFWVSFVVLTLGKSLWSTSCTLRYVLPACVLPSLSPLPVLSCIALWVVIKTRKGPYRPFTITTNLWYYSVVLEWQLTNLLLLNMMSGFICLIKQNMKCCGSKGWYWIHAVCLKCNPWTRTRCHMRYKLLLESCAQHVQVKKVCGQRLQVQFWPGPLLHAIHQRISASVSCWCSTHNHQYFLLCHYRCRQQVCYVTEVMGAVVPVTKWRPGDTVIRFSRYSVYRLDIL